LLINHKHAAIFNHIAGGDLLFQGCRNYTLYPEDVIWAYGFSYYPRELDVSTNSTITAPYDYAVLFLWSPKNLPSYYQYNYLTNVSLQTQHHTTTSLFLQCIAAQVAACHVPLEYEALMFGRFGGHAWCIRAPSCCSADGSFSDLYIHASSPASCLQLRH
jgi:hypothetical protein